MARKKSRPASRSPGSITVAEPTARGTPSASPAPPTLHSAQPASSAAFRDTPLGWGLWKLFRMAASLQLAIILLSVFAATLAVATTLESWYSTPIAQNLVYRTWWFALLLTLLAVNILCAALKKYPWKKYQTGFLITHLGLEVLVFGGLLTWLYGVEGMVVALDTGDKEILNAVGRPQTARSMNLNDLHCLEGVSYTTEDLRDRDLEEVLRAVVNEDTELTPDQIKKLGKRYWSFNFNPGSFTWHADKYVQPHLPLPLKLLKVLADPFPGFQADIDNDTRLVIDNYYPHTERWPVSDAGSKEAAFPAARLRLKGERASTVWALGRVPETPSTSEVNVDMMELTEPALLPEFLDPPLANARDMGKDGQLVIAVGHGKEAKIFRIPVERGNLDRAARELPGTGLHVKLVDFDHLNQLDQPEQLREMHRRMQKRSPEEYPTLKLEVSGPRGTGTYLACARLPHRSGLLSGDAVADLSFWYHYPDFRWGRPQDEAPETLQLLQAPGEEVYYRVFAGDGLIRKARPINPYASEESYTIPSDPVPITFQVTAYKPRAIYETSYVPQDLPPGVDNPSLQPAVRFTLTTVKKHPDLPAQRVEKHLWARMGQTDTQVEAGNRAWIIRYRPATQPLGFALKVNRAREVKDPGTDRAAAYESEVTLIVNKNGREEKSDHRIYMNHTLDYGRYKFYQANYQPLRSGRSWVTDSSGRAVSETGLQVAYDPGLWFKYAGSLIVVAGIAVMFYMRAYFFKPRGGKRVSQQELDANPVQT